MPRWFTVNLNAISDGFAEPDIQAERKRPRPPNFLVIALRKTSFNHTRRGGAKNEDKAEKALLKQVEVK